MRFDPDVNSHARWIVAQLAQALKEQGIGRVEDVQLGLRNVDGDCDELAQAPFRALDPGFGERLKQPEGCERVIHGVQDTQGGVS